MSVSPSPPLPPPPAAGTPIAAGLADLHACLDRLSNADPPQLPTAELAALLREAARAEARLAAVRLTLLSAADRARAAATAGATDTGAWAAAVTRADPADAARQARLARALMRREATRRALASGRVSAQHAAVIAATDQQLPAGVTQGERARVEADLVSKAESMSPGLLRRHARRALAAIEPDPAVVDAHENEVVAAEEAAARAKTRLSLHDNADGTVTGHFTLPTFHGQLLGKILQTMTAPRRARPGARLAQSGTPAGHQVDPGHARGTAFCELIEHLPTDRLHPKTAATIVVAIAEESLTARLSAAGRLDTGAELSAGETRRMACGAGIIPAVLGGGSRVLDLGRSARLFSASQRIALGLRHATCAASGCERPFSWCELHHREPWAHGGLTDLDQAVPLCAFHHQRIHDPGYRHHRLPDHTIAFHRRV